MKTAVEWFNKQPYEKLMVPGNAVGYTNSSGKRRDYYITYRFEGEDLVIDGSNIEYQDFGRQGCWKSPLFVIRIDLALEMGWFERKEPPPSDP